MVHKGKSSYGFPCWSCGKSVLASQSRAGKMWYSTDGHSHCSKECAEKTEANDRRIKEAMSHEANVRGA